MKGLGDNELKQTKGQTDMTATISSPEIFMGA